MAKQNNDEFLRFNRLGIVTILRWNTNDLLVFNHYFKHKLLMECIKNNKVCVKKTERKWIRWATNQTNGASVSVCVSLSVCYRECLPGPISGCVYPAQNRWIDEYPVSHGPTPRPLTAVSTTTDGSIPKYRDSPGAGIYD